MLIFALKPNFRSVILGGNDFSSLWKKMLDYHIAKDDETKEIYLETSVYGKALLTIPQLNKGTAFTQEERHIFGLIGKLPYQVETLDDQVKRAYHQFLAYKSTLLQQHIYLNN